MAMNAFFKDDEFLMVKLWTSREFGNSFVKMLEISPWIKKLLLFLAEKSENIGKSENLKVWFACIMALLVVLHNCAELNLEHKTIDPK